MRGFLIFAGFGTFLEAYEQGTQYFGLSPIRFSKPWSRGTAGCTRVDRESFLNVGFP